MFILHPPAGDLHSEVLSKQHSHQVWSLKTSASCWASPLRSQKRQTSCASTCLILGEVGEWGVGATVLSQCIVRSVIRGSCWADLRLGPAPSLSRLYRVKQAEAYFFIPLFFLSAQRYQNQTPAQYISSGCEEMKRQRMSLSSPPSILTHSTEHRKLGYAWHFEMC